MTDRLEYKRKWQSNLRKERRKFGIEYLGGECICCGTTKRLQFDHIDPDTKEHKMSDLTLCSKDRFMMELNKCQLLCIHCHSSKSHTERGHGGVDHGTASRYVNDGCRCSDCREAWTLYFVPKRKLYRQAV